MCSKWATESHSSSKEHSSKITELAACDEMIGVAPSKRRFESTPGLTGTLSRKAFRSYWGADVDSGMGEILRDRLMKGAQLEVKLTKRFSRKITMSNLITCGMSIVSYPGSCK